MFIFISKMLKQRFNSVRINMFSKQDQLISNSNMQTFRQHD